MCGIFGGYNIKKNEVENAILKINRGDDGITTIELDKEVIFSARRHLVKKSGNDDTNSSDQPYFSTNKKIAIIFNGEFYNFDKYKKKLEKDNIKFSSTGDTEVFLKLYEKEGINFLYDNEIDSLYSIAIFDKKKKQHYYSTRLAW